ncbi:MAG TPA: hypothetical protein VM618_03760 [Acidimicrobiia bacterium]|nr:hypothetical protein [Acidimicrobiia bacterium]
MEAVSYAERPRRRGVVSPARHAAVDATLDAVEFHGDDRLETLVRRAADEQLGVERLVQHSLRDLAVRLDGIERSIADQVDRLTAELAGRMASIERVMAERVAAYETVLRRVVDRMEGMEAQLLDAVEHGDRVVRSQIDAVRARTETVAEQARGVMESAAGDQAAVTRALEDLRHSVEHMGREIGERLGERLAADASPAFREIDGPVPDASVSAAPASDAVSPFPGFVPVTPLPAAAASAPLGDPAEATLVDDDAPPAPATRRTGRRRPSTRQRPLRAR